jgi:large subunit ribosomal protein L13
MKTTLEILDDNQRKWFVVDATGKPAGRLAVEVATLLRGKNKITFAPHIDNGDFVVVINAEKVKLTGSKEQKKIYQNYSGYIDGLKRFTAAQVRAKNPTRIVTQAVKGMLPRNKQSRSQLKRLKVYAGPEHPHAAQKPAVFELSC